MGRTGRAGEASHGGTFPGSTPRPKGTGSPWGDTHPRSSEGTFSPQNSLPSPPSPAARGHRPHDASPTSAGGTLSRLSGGDPPSPSPRRPLGFPPARPGRLPPSDSAGSSHHLARARNRPTADRSRANNGSLHPPPPPPSLGCAPHCACAGGDPASPSALTNRYRCPSWGAGSVTPPTGSGRVQGPRGKRLVAGRVPRAAAPQGREGKGRGRVSTWCPGLAPRRAPPRCYGAAAPPSRVVMATGRGRVQRAGRCFLTHGLSAEGVVRGCGRNGLGIGEFRFLAVSVS